MAENDEVISYMRLRNKVENDCENIKQQIIIAGRDTSKLTKNLPNLEQEKQKCLKIIDRLKQQNAELAKTELQLSELSQDLKQTHQQAHEKKRQIEEIEDTQQESLSKEDIQNSQESANNLVEKYEGIKQEQISKLNKTRCETDYQTIQQVVKQLADQVTALQASFNIKNSQINKIDQDLRDIETTELMKRSQPQINSLNLKLAYPKFKGYQDRTTDIRNTLESQNQQLHNSIQELSTLQDDQKLIKEQRQEIISEKKRLDLINEQLTQQLSQAQVEYENSQEIFKQRLTQLDEIKLVYENKLNEYTDLKQQQLNEKKTKICKFNNVLKEYKSIKQNLIKTRKEFNKQFDWKSYIKQKIEKKLGLKHSDGQARDEQLELINNDIIKQIQEVYQRFDQQE